MDADHFATIGVVAGSVAALALVSVATALSETYALLMLGVGLFSLLVATVSVATAAIMSIMELLDHYDISFQQRLDSR